MRSWADLNFASRSNMHTWNHEIPIGINLVKVKGVGHEKQFFSYRSTTLNWAMTSGDLDTRSVTYKCKKKNPYTYI